MSPYPSPLIRPVAGPIAGRIECVILLARRRARNGRFAHVQVALFRLYGEKSKDINPRNVTHAIRHDRMTHILK